ncbi:Translation initiation factor 2 [hydrothermal vent metagenome]|uniref:Translation initiation factor 2 n=1 Tax=hydrothermal vent metagenome TaxID=652676 RepID=A0A3B0TV79_9ZZZZ
MSDTKDTGDTKLRLSGSSTLSLKGTAGSGRVRQSMSHGRSKTVVVEKKRKRILRPGETPPPAAPQPPAEKAPAPTPAPVAKKPVAEATARRGSGVVLRTLTSDEKDARAHALAESRVREAEDRVRAKDDAAVRATEEERQKQEAEQAAARKAEEEERRKNDEAEKARREEEARRRLETDAGDGSEEARRPADRKRGPSAPPPVKTPGRKPAPGGRPRGKLTISNALNDQPRQRSLASMRRRIERGKKQARGTAQPQAKVMREVVIPDAITIQELANRMTERAVDVVRLLMQQGHMLNSDDVIDADMAQLITEEMGHTVRRVSEADVEVGLHVDNDEEGDLSPRAPIVTVMGHVDHGKTSLLDALRSADVVSGEAGGITQHIGAYQVTVPGGEKVTFIDTPGHAAFTAMRARGAKVTDLVILVVAADDGVMPQTIEAINHARAAEVPLIIAINKMDKHDADPTRVRNELLQHEIVVESLGGETMEFEISALKKTGLDKLIEGVLLQSEVLELKANPNRPGDGVVIEAKLDRGRGPVATALVQRGTIRVGDIVVAGAEYGRVRALVNDHGDNVTEAGPSEPIEILGLGGAPGAGDQFSVVENEARAREISEYRQRLNRDSQMVGTGVRVSLEQMMTQIKESGRKEVAVVVKADVQGSVEAIVGALDNLSTEEVVAQTVHKGVGGITESDVALAATSGAVILAFDVRANAQARAAAESAGVEIRYYSVIYNLVDDVKAAMSGLLDPELRETFLGNAEILQVFNITKVGKVAGCKVTEGVVRRGSHVRLIRDDVVIHEGTLGMLKRFKDEVKEVISGQECGMSFEKYHDLKEGDIIECFDVEKVERTL